MFNGFKREQLATRTVGGVEENLDTATSIPFLQTRGKRELTVFGKPGPLDLTVQIASLLGKLI